MLPHSQTDGSNLMSGERDAGNWEVRRRDGGSAKGGDDLRSNRAARDQEGDEEVEVDCYGAKRLPQAGTHRSTRTRGKLFIIAFAAAVMIVLIALPSMVDLSQYLSQEEKALSTSPRTQSEPFGTSKLGYETKDALGDGGACSYDELFEYAKGRGISADKLKIANFPCNTCDGGLRRGMAARANIAKGEALIHAPWSAVISAEFSLDPALLQALAVFEDAPISKTDKLALFLMYHRFRADSPFRPYICTLPLNHTSPLFWDDDRLLAHGPLSTLHVRTTSAKLFLIQQYNRLLPLLFKRSPEIFSPSVHSLPVWLWAAQTVKSRNWYVNRKRPPAILHAMVPVADMINHRMQDGGGGRTSKDGNLFEVVAGKDYVAGEEVFTSYSDDCNIYYLMTYGFEVEGNGLNCSKTHGGKGKETDWQSKKQGST
mmetsp:Transcript_57329/g.117323  ORF Transcript_57329/g.117323 Transcript_57329/m.117323 type:complete len:428 (+) Transcript_57329:69-1352(+)